MLPDQLNTDVVLGVTIPSRNARGRMARLGPTLDAILANHGYPPVIERLLADLAAHGIAFRDLRTRQSSLEDIFVGLVHRPAAPPEPARAPAVS